MNTCFFSEYDVRNFFSYDMRMQPFSIYFFCERTNKIGHCPSENDLRPILFFLSRFEKNPEEKIGFIC